MFDLSDFIASCRSALQSDASVTIKDIVAKALQDPAAIKQALGTPTVGEPPAAQYLFLHQSPELTIMHVCVPAHFKSPPHNHLAWAVIGMYEGAERNRLYRRDGGAIVEEQCLDVAAPGVLTLSGQAIHSISNPLAQPSLALHVYGGTLANPMRSLWDPFTWREQPFQREALSRFELTLNSNIPDAAAH